MGFDNGKYNDKVSGKLPEWKASDGAFKEKPVEKENKGKLNMNEEGTKKQGEKKAENLTGYVPSASEKQEKNAPKKMLDVENSYGTFSIGMSKDNELTTLTTQKRSREIDTVRNVSKELNSSSATAVHKIPGKARSNNERKEESAVEYRGTSGRAASFFLDRMNKFINKCDFDMHEEIVPVFSTQNERKELRELREQRRAMLKNGGTAKDKKEVENQIEYLEATIRDKDMERRKMQNRLESVRTDISENKAEAFRNRFLNMLDEMDADKNDGTENNENPDENKDKFIDPETVAGIATEVGYGGDGGGDI